MEVAVEVQALVGVVSCRRPEGDGVYGCAGGADALPWRTYGHSFLASAHSFRWVSSEGQVCRSKFTITKGAVCLCLPRAGAAMAPSFFPDGVSLWRRSEFRAAGSRGDKKSAGRTERHRELDSVVHVAADADVAVIALEGDALEARATQHGAHHVRARH